MSTERLKSWHQKTTWDDRVVGSSESSISERGEVTTKGVGRAAVKGMTTVQSKVRLLKARRGGARGRDVVLGRDKVTIVDSDDVHGGTR